MEKLKRTSFSVKRGAVCAFRTLGMITLVINHRHVPAIESFRLFLRSHMGTAILRDLSRMITLVLDISG